MNLGCRAHRLRRDQATAAAAAPTVACVASSRATAIADTLKGLVSDGTITQAQADKVASTLAAAPPERGFGHGAGVRAGDLTAAATALKLSQTDLRTQLDNGKSLADVAKAQARLDDDPRRPAPRRPPAAAPDLRGTVRSADPHSRSSGAGA